MPCLHRRHCEYIQLHFLSIAGDKYYNLKSKKRCAYSIPTKIIIWKIYEVSNKRFIYKSIGLYTLAPSYPIQMFFFGIKTCMKKFKNEWKSLFSHWRWCKTKGLLWIWNMLAAFYRWPRSSTFSPQGEIRVLTHGTSLYRAL